MAEIRDEKKLKEHTFNRWEQLKQDSEYHEYDWRDCSDFIEGSRGRFLGDSEDKKSYRRRNDQLYNPVAKRAARILMSGMQAGVTSPARPWFKLGTTDSDLNEYGPVKIWLDDVRTILLDICARSNFYNMTKHTYLEIAGFGTACKADYEDFDAVMYYEPYTVGGYRLGSDARRSVDTMYRKYEKPVGSLAKRFGKENLSRSAQNILDKNQETRIPILHAIEPNIGRDFNSPLAADMPYRSTYYEFNGDGYKALGRSGFNERPFTAVRWNTVDEDIYASSWPGIDCLSTNKALQINELDSAIATEKMHNPPLVGDALLQIHGVDQIAGGISYIPGMMQSPRPGLAPIYTVNPDISALSGRMSDQEAWIERFFFVDLFLMISQMDETRTATEIVERKEEKMIMLGPVLESLNNEFLDPTIDRMFARANRAGIIPPPPPELEGMKLGVEYIGILAQAQKAVSTFAIESTVGFAGNLSTVWPEAKFKIDPFQAIDEYARAKGASPKILRSDKDATQEYTQQQQMVAAQAAAEAAPGVTQAAKTMSETQLTADQNLLESLTGT